MIQADLYLHATGHQMGCKRLEFIELPRVGDAIWCPLHQENPHADGQTAWKVREIAHWASHLAATHHVALYVEPTNDAAHRLAVTGQDDYKKEEPCGCEGSCPVCRTGEVSDHRCDRCRTVFCPVCHGVLAWSRGICISPNTAYCQCKKKDSDG